MLCQVLAIRKQGNLNIAHVQMGDKYGDCLASPGVEVGKADMRPELRIKAGRFEAIVKVFPIGVINE